MRLVASLRTGSADYLRGALATRENTPWEQGGGFSVDALVRNGRERLLRYCARQAFTLERLFRY